MKRSDGELVRALPTLQKHWGLLSGQIQRLLNYRQDQALISYEVVGDVASAGLEGVACERAHRNRGKAAAVLPIADLAFGNLSAWVGFQEVWLKRRGSTYLFSNAAMTVYLGRRGSTDKFQAFRAEWAGPVGYDQGVPQFQSPGAGHPHWNIDLLDTVLSPGYRRVRDDADDLRASLQGEEVIREFGPTSQVPADDFELVQRYPLSRFHFASAASWWMENAEHAHPPADEIGMRRWVLKSLDYIRSELRKV